jgi:FAD/FMN-containing dehydrogenase
MNTVAMIDRSVLRKFATGLRGPLILPDDAAYESARRVWYQPIDRHPAAIARCIDREDVVHAIDFARSSKLSIAVRSGGHSSFATCEGGLVIDLTMMKGVEVDSSNRLVRAEPGLTSGELDAATCQHGLATPLGECPTTGIGGLTLGGGYRLSARKLRTHL